MEESASKKCLIVSVNVVTEGDFFVKKYCDEVSKEWNFKLVNMSESIVDAKCWCVELSAKVSQVVNETCDTFKLVIVCHGGISKIGSPRKNIIFHQNKNYFLSVQDVINCLSDETCPNLKGKKRIIEFFCCIKDTRVCTLENKSPLFSLPLSEVEKKSDGETGSLRDMIIVWSTVNGSLSLRSESGSNFVQSLCNVIESNTGKADISYILRETQVKVDVMKTAKGIIQVTEFKALAFERQLHFHAEELLEFIPEEERNIYNLTQKCRGYCVIVNQTFKGTDAERNGSKVDMERLQKIFTKLQFDVVPVEDEDDEKTLSEIKRCSSDNINHEAFIVIIMSHGYAGNRTNYIETSKDNVKRMISVEKVIKLFNSEQLKGKPKLLMLNICRGGAAISDSDSDSSKLIEDTVISSDSEDPFSYNPEENDGELTELADFVTVPLSSVDSSTTQLKKIGRRTAVTKQIRPLRDTLFCWSTIDGYDTKSDPISGSIFSKTFLNCMRAAEDLDILQVMRKVEFEMNETERSTQNLEVNPIGLRKFLYFSKSTKGEQNYYELNSDPTGLCLIINNYEFENDIRRTLFGTHADVRNYEEVFKKLKFDVRIKANISMEIFISTLQKLFAESENHSAFVLIFISHSLRLNNTDWLLFSDGERMSVDKLKDMLNEEKFIQMRKKPKIVILQTSRKASESSYYSLSPCFKNNLHVKRLGSHDCKVFIHTPFGSFESGETYDKHYANICGKDDEINETTKLNYEKMVQEEHVVSEKIRQLLAMENINEVSQRFISQTRAELSDALTVIKTKMKYWENSQKMVDFNYKFEPRVHKYLNVVNIDQCFCEWNKKYS
ncbi:caspase Nc-like protein [Leptotrombidium deliense]|uniref:Caspase Nc-like protein n=1 Tax=Leptotrombidium deliense TaxID=299467 RepID=A0A443S7Y0_9ACAR|nr:caspase Nc-like protein [Leptotrombidium deliense]